MSEQNTTFNWNDIRAKNDNEEYPLLQLVQFNNNVLPVITFTDNNPISAKPNQFGRIGYLFKVRVQTSTEDHGFYTSSIRVMQELKKYAPIKDKSFAISRTGTGKETKYTVEEV